MKPAPVHRVAYSSSVAFTDPLDKLVLSEIDSIANEQRQRRVRQRADDALAPPAEATPKSRDLLRPNEVAFIDRIVSWVYARPHKDAILAEIQARLFEPADSAPVDEAVPEMEQEEMAPAPAEAASALAEADSESLTPNAE